MRRVSTQSQQLVSRVTNRVPPQHLFSACVRGKIPEGHDKARPLKRAVTVKYGSFFPVLTNSSGREDLPLGSLARS